MHNICFQKSIFWGVLQLLVLNLSAQALRSPAEVLQKKGKDLNDYLSVALRFSEGLANVTSHNERLGYIDTEGNYAFPLMYSETDFPEFHDGIALVSTLTEEGMKSVYIDKTGKVAFSTQEYSELSPFREGLARVIKAGKTGYIDTKGKVILPFIYEEGDDFYQGFATVLKNGKTLAIDKTGKELTKAPFFQLITNEKQQFGLVNHENKVILPVEYQEVLLNRQLGLIKVRKEEKWGLMTLTGEVILPLEYDEVEYDEKREIFYLTIVPEEKEEELRGFADKQGKVLFLGKIQYFNTVGDEIYILNEKGEVGVVNKQGKWLLPLENQMESAILSEGLTTVTKGGKYGLCAEGGEIVIPIQYEKAGCLKEGLIAAKKEGKYGFIDKQGKTVIPFQYEEAGAFHEGMAFVKKEGKWGFIDKTNKVVIPFQYETNEAIEPSYKGDYFFHEGLIALLKEGKMGFIDKTGKVIIPFQYEIDEFQFSVTQERYVFQEGLAAVRQGGKWGFIDKTGKVVIPFQYEFVETAFYGGGAEVNTSDGKNCFINRLGKVIKEN